MSSLAAWLGAGGGATVLTSGLGGLAFRLVKRAAKDAARVFADEIKADVVSLKLDFAKQVGGNSNGLRQKLDEVGKDVAELKGAFGQHLKEGGK